MSDRKLANIENVFFDLDDTLWACSQNAKNALEKVYHKYQFDRYFDSFFHFYSLYSPENEILWREYGSGAITKDELNKRRFSYPLLSVGIDKYDLVEQYRTSFFEQIKKEKELMPGAKELLDYLAPNYNLYILSNGFRELQYSKMEASGILSYFKEILLSEDFGVLKPDREIFHQALATTHSLIENSVMVGDNWETDILGAKNVGLVQIFYNPGLTEVPLKNRSNTTYPVVSLAEIKTLL
ncbi:MAG: noncanonical pyrimidine nucleotidase, YjjG family [Bacteroidales bacterium]|nr:noncanonical pyrimidine nucleotidase, YjjG family [Bacteroidales bacterium]